MKEGWEYKKLGEVAEIIGGSTPKTDIPEYWDGDNYWVTPAELDGSKYIEKTQRTITQKAIEKTNLSLLPIGTVLLSSRAPIGKLSITKSPMYCNQGFKNIVCGESLYNEFVYYYLKNNVDYLQSLGTGATFKEISKKVVEKIEMPVPSITEQQQIVSELDLLSGVIEKQKAQLEELDKLAQSIFYDMFGDPVANEKGWEISKYGNHFNVSSGGTPSKSNSEYWDKGTIPWIGSNMCQNCIVYENDGKYITEKGLKNSSANMLNCGTVLIALVGATIGKVALLKKEMATNQNIANINVWDNKGFDPMFIFYHSMNLYHLFINLGDGGFKMANQGFIRELPLILPPLSLQQEFAAKVEAIEAMKAKVRQSLKEAETLFNERMDYYFN